jgi:hypothetical protein
MEDREMCPERQLTRVSVKDNFTGLVGYSLSSNYSGVEVYVVIHEP